MKSMMTFKLASGLLLLGLIATPVLAQQTSESATPTHAASRAAKRIDAVKQRITELHSALKITTAQSPQWNALAQVMQDNAEATGKRMHQLKSAATTMNAQQNMQAYAELAQEHATNMQKLSAAFTALYDVLSDDQKATADTLFQHKTTMRHKAKHRAPATSSDAVIN